MWQRRREGSALSFSFLFSLFVILHQSFSLFLPHPDPHVSPLLLHHDSSLLHLRPAAQTNKTSHRYITRSHVLYQTCLFFKHVTCLIYELLFEEDPELSGTKPHPGLTLTRCLSHRWVQSVRECHPPVWRKTNRLVNLWQRDSRDKQW